MGTDPKLGMSLALTMLSLFIFLVYGSRLPNFMSWSLADDADTVLYTDFAKNLNRFDLSDTRGIMSEHVGKTASPLFEGNALSFYHDHPPFMIWGVAAVLKFSDYPYAAARSFNLFLSLTFVLMSSLIVIWFVGPWPGLVSFLILFGIPLFWVHSIVVNIQAMTVLTSLISAFFFAQWLFPDPRLRFLNSTRSLSLALFFFVCAALSDWPSYFLLVPVGFVLIFQKRWLVLLGLFFGSVLLFFCTVGFLQSSHSEVQQGMLGFVDTFKSFLNPHLGGSPVKYGIVDSWLESRQFFHHGFGKLAELFLVLLIYFAVLSFLRGRQFLSFLFFCVLSIAFFNSFVFHQWAASHSYWNFYFIPVFILGTGVILLELKNPRTQVVVMVLIFLGSWSMLPMTFRAWSKKHTAETEFTRPFEDLKKADLISMVDEESQLYAFSRLPMHHFASINRQIIDRTLLDVRKLSTFCGEPRKFLLLGSHEVQNFQELSNLPWIHLENLHIRVLKSESLQSPDCALLKKFLKN